MTSTTMDSENPEVLEVASKNDSWLNVDPAFSTTVVSIFANFTLSNMFLYGMTGNAKLSYLASVATVPASLFVCVKAANEDFERWKKMRHLREKGLPPKLMPYPYKHDWTDYEAKLAHEKALQSLNEEKKSVLSGSSKTT